MPITTGSSDLRPFGKWFQIRWAERLGDPNNPYLVRWTFILFGRSIRIHHWIRGDDNRYFHDHSANMISIMLKGWYWNVTPINPKFPPNRFNIGGVNTHRTKAVAFRKNWLRFISYRAQHYLDIPPNGCWTLLLEGKARQKWGFFVPIRDGEEVRKLRPYRYFKKYGIIQADPNYRSWT